MENKNKLITKIENDIKNNISNSQWINDKISFLNQKYDIPVGISSDILTLRTNLRDTSDFILFCITSAVLSNLNFPEYFNSMEISAFTTAKYTVKKIKFPYAFKNMIEIRPDSQWIGKITCKELMMLRDAQLINYNENAQRTLKHVIGDTFEYNQIDLNRKAVNEIMELYRNNMYIPNTITLNLPDDADFIYNKQKNELVIKGEVKFDILDGYHRYISMSNMSNLDMDFDYEMELRLVSFSPEMARQFIYQEDQKTKMAKIDSNALSSQNNGNKIVHLIENKILNVISRNNGIIDETVLSQLVNIICLKNKKYERGELNKIRDIFVEAIYDIQDYYPDLLKHKWSIEFTISFMVLLYMYQIDHKYLYNETVKLETLIKENKNILNGRVITRVIITRVKNLYAEV